jgi:ADP-ribose pyrophosphatase
LANQDSESTGLPSWVSEGAGAHDHTLAENWLFCLRQERFRSRLSGKTHDYYVTYLADGVQVVAITPDQRVVLVRQFRAGSRRDSLEMPGGLIEPGEDPFRAGARELLEETGYAGLPPERLGTIWPNPAILSMRITTIVVRDAQPRALPRPDQSEELSVELCHATEIRSLIQRGRIDHGACVAGLLWWLSIGQDA